MTRLRSQLFESQSQTFCLHFTLGTLKTVGGIFMIFRGQTNYKRILATLVNTSRLLMITHIYRLLETVNL